MPRELSTTEIEELVHYFRSAAIRAQKAGVEFLEIHAAHGYLLHSFLSPLSNCRSDKYGGDFSGRTRFLRDVVQEVRAVWPNHLPLAVRLSCSDWTEGGWSLADSVQISQELRNAGVDLIDCSSGGILPSIQIPTSPGYQVQFAKTIKQDAMVMTAAVGLITTPIQAEDILKSDAADLVLIGRAALRDAYWPINASRTLELEKGSLIPKQYQRAY
jgi:2,4-dienoyl-CoA reductase-like NADH-dependent reductase (Old Yellow Enzyme family)